MGRILNLVCVTYTHTSTILRNTTPRNITLHYTIPTATLLSTLHYTSLHYSTLDYSALHRTTSLHTTPHYATLDTLLSSSVRSKVGPYDSFKIKLNDSNWRRFGHRRFSIASIIHKARKQTRGSSKKKEDDAEHSKQKHEEPTQFSIAKVWKMHNCNPSYADNSLDMTLTLHLG